MKKNFFKAITIGLTEKTAIVIRILFIIFIISLPLFIAVMFVGGGFWGFMLAIFLDYRNYSL